MTAELPERGRGGSLRNTASGGLLRRGRITPSRSSRDSLPFGVSWVLPVTGSSRATGRPRSTMSTDEPAFSRSIRALKLFLASVMLATFIEP